MDDIRDLLLTTEEINEVAVEMGMDADDQDFIDYEKALCRRQLQKIRDTKEVELMLETDSRSDDLVSLSIDDWERLLDQGK